MRKDKNQQYQVLKSVPLLELYNILNEENISNHKACALREVDVSKLLRIKEEIEKKEGPVSTSALVAKALALNLAEFPKCNRTLIEWPFFRRLVQHLQINVGLAVEKTDSINDYECAFIYTVYDADQKSPVEITRELSGLVNVEKDQKDPRLKRWRDLLLGSRFSYFKPLLSLVFYFHKNFPPLYIKNRGGAAMISSPSKYGVDFIVAHWPMPIGVSFGLIKDRPWVIDGSVVIRPTMMLTLAFDRRIISGSLAARFMNRFAERIENAEV